MNMFTDKETREKRETMCNGCDQRNEKRCSQCGCFIMLLTKVKYANCPLNKW